jgi:hypothetical protein
MKNYEIAGTPKTPEVRFDPQEGVFVLKGRSIHENSDRFYTPIFELLETYGKDPASSTTATFELEYFNTSSARYILDIIKKLEEISLSGNKVSIRWIFEEGDLDMEEAGRDYADLVELDIQVISQGIINKK